MATKPLPTAALWLIWAFVAFVAFNVYAPPDPTGMSEPKGAGALLTLLRDDGDTKRYYAYANAMLGRPYDQFFVRPGEDGSGGGAHGLVTPDHALIPWRDFPVEYPPGVLIAALPPALIATDFASYHFLFSLEMELMLTAAAWLGVRSAERLRPGAGRPTLVLSIVYLIALGVVGARRYDALVALAIAGAAYALVARKPAFTGFALALSVLAKGAPALLAPIGAWHLLLTNRGAFFRAGAAAAASAIVGLAAYLALAGGHAFDALLYHADRPVQIESPYGAALMIAQLFERNLFRVEYGFGSHNIVAGFEPTVRAFAQAITVIALVAVYWVYALRAPRLTDEASRLRLTFAAASAALIAFIAFGKVFSPQYLTWLLPLAVIPAALGSERTRLLLIAGVAAAQIEYPFVYQMATAYWGPILGATALIRDALLIGAALSLLSDTARSELQ